MVRTSNGILISSREFEALPNYSFSLPTGTTIGKKWRCADGKGGWMLGEYVASMKPGCVAIQWDKLILPEMEANRGN